MTVEELANKLLDKKFDITERLNWLTANFEDDVQEYKETCKIFACAKAYCDEYEALEKEYHKLETEIMELENMAKEVE